MYIPYPIESGYIGNMNTFGIMFICTGNICRSPLAHAVFEQMVKKNDLGQKIEVESSGTNSYHRGEQPDDRMRRTAERHGLIINHRSRRLSRLDVVTRRLILQKARRHQDKSRLRLLVSPRFQVLFHSPPGVLFTTSLTVLVRYR